MVNPLDVPTPGTSGPVRDLMRGMAEQQRNLRHVRATALTGQQARRGAWTVRLSAAVSVPNATWTRVDWPTVEQQVGDAVMRPHAGGLRTVVAGMYWVGSRIHFVGGGASAPRELRVKLDAAVADTASETTADPVSLSLGRPVWLAANVTVTAEAYQSSGGPLDAFGTASFGHLTVALMREG